MKESLIFLGGVAVGVAVPFVAFAGWLLSCDFGSGHSQLRGWLKRKINRE